MPLEAFQVRAQRAMVQASKGRRKLRRRKVPRSQEPPTLQYRLELVKLAREIIEIIREEVLRRLPVIQEQAKIDRPDDQRLDAVEDEIERIVGNVRLRIGRTFTDDRLQEIADRQGKIIDKFSKNDVQRQFKAVLGIDLPANRTIAPHMRLFVRENVSLIKSIPEQLLGQVEKIVNRGVREGLRASDMATEIRDKFDVTERRARGIAKDQVQKLNGELNQLRQQDVGVTEYIWRNSQDERVRGNPDGLYPKARPSHWTREGQSFTWNDPPEDGHPGQPIGCRCRAEPVFTDVLAELGI